MAQDLGFSLAEISDLLKPIPLGKQPSAAEVGAMMAGWQDVIQARIDGLTELRDKMDGCIGCGCLSKEDCPLRNPDDRLGQNGSGARLLKKGR